MNEQERPDYLSILEQTFQQFNQEYEGIKPGDVKLMALWDVSEQTLAQKDYESNRNKLRDIAPKEGGSLQLSMLADIVASEFKKGLIEDRISTRSSERIDYYEETIRARKWLKKLARARTNAYSEPFEESLNEAAFHVLVFAQIKVIKHVAPKPFLREIL